MNGMVVRTIMIESLAFAESMHFPLRSYITEIIVPYKDSLGNKIEEKKKSSTLSRCFQVGDILRDFSS